MTTKHIKKTVLASVIAFGLVAMASGPAHAGRGGSLGKILQAIDSNSTDAIIAEIERAEKLTCHGCGVAILDLVDHADYRVREVAAWWMSKRPGMRVKVRDMMVTRLAGSDITLARNAADVLGAFMHPDAMAPLSTALARTELAPIARAAAAKGLAFIGHPTALPALETATRDADASVRRASVAALRELRTVTASAASNLAIADADASVRLEAVMNAGKFRDAAARTALETALTDADARVRENAAWALGELGDLASLAALRTVASSDPSVIVRGVAMTASKRLR